MDTAVTFVRASQRINGHCPSGSTVSSRGKREAVRRLARLSRCVQFARSRASRPLPRWGSQAYLRSHWDGLQALEFRGSGFGFLIMCERAARAKTTRAHEAILHSTKGTLS